MYVIGSHRHSLYFCVLVNSYYNIASKAAQSNSVYVSVLKIPIVHADSVSKSLRAGKNNIFTLLSCSPNFDVLHNSIVHAKA